jgi:hypothetical protein
VRALAPKCMPRKPVPPCLKCLRAYKSDFPATKINDDCDQWGKCNAMSPLTAALMTERTDYAELLMTSEYFSTEEPTTSIFDASDYGHVVPILLGAQPCQIDYRGCKRESRNDYMHLCSHYGLPDEEDAEKGKGVVGFMVKNGIDYGNGVFAVAYTDPGFGDVFEQTTPEFRFGISRSEVVPFMIQCAVAGVVPIVSPDDPDECCNLWKELFSAESKDPHQNSVKCAKDVVSDDGYTCTAYNETVSSIRSFYVPKRATLPLLVLGSITNSAGDTGLPRDIIEMIAEKHLKLARADQKKHLVRFGHPLA